MSSSVNRPQRGRARLALGAVAAAALIAAAIGIILVRNGDEASSETRRAAVVDERTGAFRGVRMGASAESVRRLLGEPAEGPGFAPAGASPAEIGVPQSIPSAGAAAPPTLLKYDDVTFLLGPSGVYGFIVAADGAATTRGVAIGDEMEKARTAYGGSCIDVAGGESLLGGGHEFYPSCGATLDNQLRVWFGRDPIRSITLVSLAHTQAGHRGIPPPRIAGQP
jgi:hypothetical protein